MFSHGRAIGTVSEIENIIGICVKGLDGADQITRHSLASLVAYLLTFTQTEHAPSSSEASSGRKSGKRDKDDESDTETSPRVPPEAAPKTLMTPSDMMNVLCNWFNRPNVTQKMRVGIIDIYAALFTSLGPSFVEAHYALIVAHLLNGLVSHVRNTSTRFEILLVRKLVGILFRDVIGIRMLSEQGQIGAIKELSSTYLRKWPALMPGQVETSPQVLVIVLKEVSGLLRQLGNAPPPVQVRRLGSSPPFIQSEERCVRTPLQNP
jgi:HEAT repeat-containing protein 5